MFGTNSCPTADVHLDGHGAPACPGTDGVLMHAEYEVREDGAAVFGTVWVCRAATGRVGGGRLSFVSSGAVVVEVWGAETFR